MYYSYNAGLIFSELSNRRISDGEFLAVRHG